jgi:hypothetical protein
VKDLRLNGAKSLGRVALVIGLSLIAIQVDADEYAYKPIEKNAVLQLKHGEKWQTDEVLRKAMENIRIELTARQSDILKESLRASEYLLLGQVVDKNIADITKNCKMPTDSDRAFHTIVLTDMTEGAGLMRTSNEIKVQRLGALGVLQTLRNYGTYFEHPNWRVDITKP